MSKNKKATRLDIVSERVEKAGKIAGIVFTVFKIVVGVTTMALFVLAAVKIGKAFDIDFGSLF